MITRRSSAKARRFLSLVVLALVVAETAVVPKLAFAAPPGCLQGGVLVVFARGSAITGGNGLGVDRSFESKAFEKLGDQLGPIPHAFIELGNQDNNGDVDPGGYPAVGGPNVFAAYFNWFVMGQYAPSVRTGTDELVALLNARANQCPGEATVIGGYSQGADVVGWAIERTGGGPSWSLTPEARRRIGYVAMYGDPKYRGNYGHYYGCYTPPWVRIDEDCGDLPRQGHLGSRNPYVPADLLSRVGSWCDTWDAVCGRGNVFTTLTGHATYQKHWIENSAPYVAMFALGKRNELNPATPPAPGGQQPPPVNPPPPPPPLPPPPPPPPPPPTYNDRPLTTISHPSGEQDVFWRSHDNNLYESWWSPGDSRWYGPISLGMGPMGSPPAAVRVPATNQVWVFWKGTDAHLWATFYDGSWHQPFMVSNAVLDSQPTASSFDTQIQVFWKGTDNNLWEVWGELPAFFRRSSLW